MMIFAAVLAMVVCLAVGFAVGCQQVQQVAPGSHEADIKALRDVEMAHARILRKLDSL